MKKLLATLLILCAGPVWAEWVQYEESESGNRFYFDPLTIRGEGTKRVWAKTELKTQTKSGWQSARSLREFDCPNERSRDLQFESFAQPNLKQSQEQWSGPSKWEYIAPGTIEKALFNKVCGKK